MMRNPTILLLLALLMPSIGPAQALDDPFRFLNIPIRGAIGIDVTESGIQQAISLALQEKYDGITFEFDAVEGHLDAGVAIAGLIHQANERTRTIAILRRAGGPALPIVFACEDWLVLKPGDASPSLRTVLQTLPPWAPDFETMTAHLSALNHACRKAMANTPAADDRKALVTALATPGTDLEFIAHPRRALRAVPQSSPVTPSTTRINIAAHGPGITGSALESTGLALLIDEGLQALREALEVDALEAQGDPGLVLVGEAAEDQFGRRARLGTIIDNAFAAIDGIDSLSSAMPWTYARAKLASPSATWRRWRYAMVYNGQSWVFSNDGEGQWIRAANNAVRRWSGVVEISEEVGKLITRGDEMLAILQASDVDRLDHARWAAAVKLLEIQLQTRRTNARDLALKSDEATREIAAIELQAE